MQDMGPPHVVIFPFPAQGHINGAMDISKKLASLGVPITFICTEAYISSMITQGFDAGGLPIQLLGLPDGLPPEKCMADTIDQIAVLIQATENMGPLLESMLNKLNEEHHIVCILYDFMLWWIGRLGKKLNIPAYIFYAMSASFFSYLIHIPGFVSEGRLPLGSHTNLSDASNVFKIPGFPSLHASEVPDISWSPNQLCAFDYTLRSTATWRDATGILFNTVYELEKEVIEALREEAPEMDIRAVGPILPASFLRGEKGINVESVDEERCLKWLDGQPLSSVLYIAFGTIASLSVSQLHELAIGLEASQHSFLWVIRIPETDGVSSQEMQGKKLNDRILPYSEYLPEGFEERTKKRGVVLWELSPQRKILAHKAIGGFLTHCGWNSTLESLCKGVPMLCWPMLGDQTMNAKFLGDVLHIGMSFKKRDDGIVSRGEVERAVRELMDIGQANKQGSLLRLRVCHVQELASKAALPGGSSHKDLHGFVQTLTQMNQQLA